MANVFQTATFVPFVALLKNEFRARFNSIERICEYAKVRFKFHYNNHFIKFQTSSLTEINRKSIISGHRTRGWW